MNAITNFDTSCYISSPHSIPTTNDPDSSPNQYPISTDMAHKIETNLHHDVLLMDDTNAVMNTTVVANEGYRIPLNSSSRCSFPDDVQTYFECDRDVEEDNEDNVLFSELRSFCPAIFQYHHDI